MCSDRRLGFWTGQPGAGAAVHPVDVAGSVLESHRLLSSGTPPEAFVDEPILRPEEEG